MPRRLALIALVLLVAGCGSGAEPSGAPGTEVAVAAKPLPEQLREARAELRRAVASGGFDEIHVRALRVRSLAGTLADRVSGLADADRNTMRAAAARAAQAADTIDAAGERGARVAAQQALPPLEAALGEFERLVALGRVEPGETTAMGSRSVRLNGELVDPLCYFMHDGRGPDHAGCALRCARGGQDLAFLEDSTGRVYPLIAAGHGRNPNEGLLGHIGRPIAVDGILFAHDRNEVLLIQSVANRGASRP